MAGALQGFVKSGNLIENTQDRTALNNLGTAPIADDISLFINNNSNTSELTIFAGEYDRISGLVTIINNTAELARLRSAVFTNGDPISIEYLDGTVIKEAGFVRDSDGETTFGFANNVELDDEFTFRPNGDFKVIRSDKVVLDNLTFLGVEQDTASFSSGLSAGDGDDSSNTFGVIDDLDYAEAFQEIYQYLDVAKYQARKKFVNDEDVATDDDFELEGVFTIRDPGNTVVEEGLNINSPGLYITNPESPLTNIQKILAFSDTFNPWEQTNDGTNDYLTTRSLSVTAGDLILNNGFDVQGITAISSSGNVDATNFTHKVPFVLNGVTYFLCLSNV
jgi:hypothetical protein